MKQSISLVIVFALVAVLTSVLAQGSLYPGTANVNFTVQNLSSVAEANVTAYYVNQNGDVDATQEHTIHPLSSEGFQASSAVGLPDNWLGSAVVSSNRDAVALVQVMWDGGTFGDGKTAGAYNGFIEGATRLYFPSLAARPGKQFSRISIQGMGQLSDTETIDITIHYYDRDGNSNATITDTVQSTSQVTYDLLQPGPKVPELPNVVVDGWLGSAVVESNSPIAGVAVTHWQLYSAAYSAVTEGETNAYLPSATRRSPNNDPVTGDPIWLQYTSVEVQNLDLTDDAQVLVSWYDRLGNELHVFTDTIPSNASHGYNTRFTESNIPGGEAGHEALYTALGDDWNGSVTIESINGVDIVAITKLQWTDDHPTRAAGSAYSSESSGYDELFLPATYRRLYGDVALQYTGAIIQNVGLIPCNDFDVQWRDRQGQIMLEYQDSLEPRIAHGYNTMVSSNLSELVDITQLGGDFRGSVYINAFDCELIGIHNTVWPAWTDGTTYNAFGK